MSSTLELANKFLMPNYGKFKSEIVRGQGVYVLVKDAAGHRRRCLDVLCGLGVNSLGHCHPKVVSAIKKQAGKLMHVSNLYATNPMAVLAERLVKMTGYKEGGQVFFCNSGTEANEAAAKLARLWGQAKYGSKKKIIISLKNSFHGRTYMSISLTGQDKMQKKFGPTVPGIKFAVLDDWRELEKLLSKIGQDVCAIIFETIQAEGGVNIMASYFYEKIGELAQKYHFLRICDEVQTGIGRTGKWLSFQHLSPEGEGPELITLAKALGGGLPNGAVIAKGDIGQSLPPGSHGSTFGGNPVACAAALAELKVIEKKDLIYRVKSLGFGFQRELDFMAKRSFPDKIIEVRGQGFMIGVELQPGYLASQVVAEMLKRGVLIGSAGQQVVRFLPPFIITEKQLAEVLEKFRLVLKKLTKANP